MPTGDAKVYLRLMEIYREQRTISHAKASRLAGVGRQLAGRYYHNGVVSLQLPPIKDALAEEAARVRADRARAEREGFMMAETFRLEDAQEDARAVMLLEGQMIAAIRRGSASAVMTVYAMWKAMEDVIPQLIEDVQNLIASPETTPERRRMLFRDVMRYQREVMELVERVMELERLYLNDPAAVVGAKLDLDIDDLQRQAIESAEALKQTAMLIDVTPETAH
jgi:hypothetical protein